MIFSSCILIFPVKYKAKNRSFNWSWWGSFTWFTGSNNPTQGNIHFICFYYYFSIFSNHFFSARSLWCPVLSDYLKSNNVVRCKKLAFIIMCVEGMCCLLEYFFIVFKDKSYPGSNEKIKTIQRHCSGEGHFVLEIQQQSSWNLKYIGFFLPFW